jgi:hypothetical protein
MRTFCEILEHLGGSGTVAAALKLPMTTVDSWKRRDSIPPSYWPPLVNVARKRGMVDISLQRLAEIAATKRRAA